MEKIVDSSAFRDGISKGTTKTLKGYFALAVLIHHLYQHSGILHETYLGVCFQLLGFYSVSVFFFLSGYGVLASYSNNPDEYITQFPQKRIFPYYCDCLLFVVMYSIFQVCISRDVTVSDILLSLSFGRTVIIKGWYLQVALLFYVCFYIVFSCVKRLKCSVTCGLAFIWGIVLLYYLSAYFLGMEYTWYVTVFSFPLGMTVASYKTKINEMILQKSLKLMLWGMVVFCLLTIIHLLHNGSTLSDYALQSLTFVMFSGIIYCACILLSTNISWIIDNRIARRLGDISFEIYACQGFFLTLFHHSFFNIVNPYMYCISVILCTIGLAICLNSLRRKMHEKIMLHVKR